MLFERCHSSAWLLGRRACRLYGGFCVGVEIDRDFLVQFAVLRFSFNKCPNFWFDNPFV